MHGVMRGAYCILIELVGPCSIAVGALGRHRFEKGVYVYVGSAQAGIGQRVARHRSQQKRMRWHIDYLLRKGEVVSTVAIPCDAKERECEIADAVSKADGVCVPVVGFGSSDCSCSSHLFYFGDVEPPWAMESLAHALTFLPCAYERTRDTG